MIIADRTEIPRAEGEWAPIAPAHLRAGLTPRALVVWLEVQAAAGAPIPGRVELAEILHLSVYAVRKAIAELRRKGLLLVERIADAAGRWSTITRYLTASPQVAPKVDFPKVGRSARIPPSTDRKRGAGVTPPHSPETCRQEQAGRPCRHCGRIRRARELEAAKQERAAFRQMRLDELAARTANTPPPVECEHGTIPTRCALCRRAGSPTPARSTAAGMMGA